MIFTNKVIFTFSVIIDILTRYLYMLKTRKYNIIGNLDRCRYKELEGNRSQ